MNEKKKKKTNLNQKGEFFFWKWNEKDDWLLTKWEKSTQISIWVVPKIIKKTLHHLKNHQISPQNLFFLSSKSPKTKWDRLKIRPSPINPPNSPTGFHNNLNEKLKINTNYVNEEIKAEENLWSKGSANLRVAHRS